MGIDKQGSKGVGSFLQMFDWNAKSRKKLFSTKSDLPEQSKQKKRCDGNLPMTRLQMLDEDEMAAISSIKGSSDYSCASSVTDEDFYGTKAPGVVARLMGLDSMPKSNIPEPYSTPLYDSQSVRDACYRSKHLESHQDSQVLHSSFLQEVRNQNVTEPKYQRVIHRPIEKFQTEILPPKSAKSIPITQHKLLSPIKSANFIPPKDAAQIMEAAARIIEPGPQASTKSKLPLVGSSLVPLRVRDLKEKVQAAQKPAKLFEGSQGPRESSTVKHLRGNLLNKSWNGLMDAEESIAGTKNKAKSISLALQAKANVQKREGINLNGNRSLANQKETSEFSPNQLFKSQSITQKTALKKSHTYSGSNVLRQNNQKQNCIVDRGKSPLKSVSQSGKAVTRDSTSASQRNSSKLGGTSKVGSRRWASEVKDDKREVLGSSSERVAHKKRSIDGNYQSERNQAAQSMRIDKNGKRIQSSAIMDRQISWDKDSRRNGTDIVSFTFTSPMTRTGPDHERSMDVGEKNMIFSSDFRSKRTLLSSDGISSSKFSFLGHNVKGSDALSTLLEQKLKELTHAVEFSNQKAGMVLQDSLPGPNASMSSTMPQENKTKDEMCSDSLFSGSGSSFYSTETQEFITGPKYQGVQEEIAKHGISISQASNKSSDCRLPSPVSVLEHCSFVESCNSSETADSNFSTGGSKKCSSVHAQKILVTYSLKTLLTIEGDNELSDSASSASAKSLAERRDITLTLANAEKPATGWELAYIKEILCNLDLMFTDYALGRTHEIINPHLFDQLERRKGLIDGCGGLIPQMDRRILFNCVSECLDLKCQQYLVGGNKLWTKGLSLVRRKERLAEEVYNEISGWTAVGDSLVDELVDKDMSNKYGRWLDFETEAFELGIQIQSRILNSLIDEVVADILVL